MRRIVRKSEGGVNPEGVQDMSKLEGRGSVLLQGSPKPVNCGWRAV